MDHAPPAPFRAALPAAGRLLEVALARVLALDPEFAAALGRLDGRRVVLQLTAPVLGVELRVEAGRIRVHPISAEGEPDLRLRASLGALLARLVPGNPRVAPGQLRIEGDVELAQTLHRLVQRYDPDFEGALSEVFGDVLGVQIARGVRAALRQSRAGTRELLRGAIEHLVEERRDLVSRAEQEAFFDEVDALRDAVERLQARIKRLAARRGASR